jgi:hypothetical protein
MRFVPSRITILRRKRRVLKQPKSQFAVSAGLVHKFSCPSDYIGQVIAEIPSGRSERLLTVLPSVYSQPNTRAFQREWRFRRRFSYSCLPLVRLRGACAEGVLPPSSIVRRTAIQAVFSYQRIGSGVIGDAPPKRASTDLDIQPARHHLEIPSTDDQDVCGGFDAGAGRITMQMACVQYSCLE